MASGLDLFQYSDYRSFLRDFTEEKRRSDRRWSYGVWAKQLRLKSSSTLIMVVNGQRNPGAPLIRNLSKYFRFDPAKSEYFENLVRLQKAKNDPSLSVLLMEELSKRHPKGRFHFLDQKSFQAISNWHYYAVREMTNLAGFQEDPEWISARLNRAISPKEAKDALKTLIDLGLLTRSSDNRLVMSEGHVSTANDIADEGLKRFHQQVLSKAHDSVRTVPTELREISGTTFAIPMENLPKAKELIRKFRVDLCKLLEKNDADAVFHLEVAFFPLTSIERKSS